MLHISNPKSYEIAKNITNVKFERILSVLNILSEIDCFIADTDAAGVFIPLKHSLTIDGFNDLMYHMKKLNEKVITRIKVIGDETFSIQYVSYELIPEKMMRNIKIQNFLDTED
jgi:hypothetical protein